jgi:hypothetical protein
LTIDVLANDLDANPGDTFKITSVSGPNPQVAGVSLVQPQQQGASYTGVTVRVDGGASGTANFVYSVVDNRGAATNNIPVALTINTIPTVKKDDVPTVVEVPAGQSVSGTIKATDIDGQALRFSLLQAPASLIGTATVNESTGAYTFTAKTVIGDGSFLVGVSDGNATVSVPVGAKVIGGTDPVPGTGTTDPVINPGTGTTPGQNPGDKPDAGSPLPPPSSGGDSGGGIINPFVFFMLAVLGWSRRHDTSGHLKK